MEKTRHFYEDILGLPLVSSLVAHFDVVTNEPSNYIHCFFELGDGSAVAFFQFEDGYRDEPFPRISDPYERHTALRADTEENVTKLHEKAVAAGVDCFIVDHDWCYSLYLTDPDGEIVEITAHRPSADEVLDQAGARETLDQWLVAAAKDK
ncbi:Glyoxalase-like domain protein [compost metagenome]